MNALFKILLLLFFEKKKRDNFYYKPRRHIDKLWRFLFLCRVSSTHGWENTLSSSCSLSYSRTILLFASFVLFFFFSPTAPTASSLTGWYTHKGLRMISNSFSSARYHLVSFFLLYFPCCAVSALFRLFYGVYKKIDWDKRRWQQPAAVSRCLKRINRLRKWAKSDSTRLLLFLLPIKERKDGAQWNNRDNNNNSNKLHKTLNSQRS